MCLVPRQFRQPAQRGRSPVVLKLLVMICSSVTVPGCAWQGIGESFFADHSFSPEIAPTIRSQNAGTRQDDRPDGMVSVAADYSPLKKSVRANDLPGNGADIDVDSPISNPPLDKSGHSFVQRRARLRRPIPLPEQKVTPSTTKADATEISHTPALTFDNSGWQPIPDQTSQLETGGSGENRNSLPRSSDNSDAMSAEAASVPNIEAAPAINVGTDSLDEPVAQSVVENEMPINKEPTVLDRLRGLYAPRREEPPLDRSRKTPRRWTDPFGRWWEKAPGYSESAADDAQSPAQTDPEISSTEARDSMLDSDPSQDLLETLIQQRERELAEWRENVAAKPAYEAEWLRRQTDLRMLYLIAGRSAESVRAIESLPEKEQEFWQSMMLAMESYRSNNEETPRAEQLTDTLEYVRTASRQLQPLSKMKVRRLNFCTRIDGFGAFSVFPVSDFNAGQPVLLYAEIENYQSELTSDGQYRSEFAAMIEFIRDGETDPIASRTIRLPDIEDLCSTERTDYFQSYELTVPSLSPGKYILRLRVRDQLSQQTSMTELPFEIRPLGSSQ